ncbi:MAG: hypothetical protein RLZZ612_979 [Pseudomonadota bacterium]|jgi:undecaprenyl-diphosphatase
MDSSDSVDVVDASLPVTTVAFSSTWQYWDKQVFALLGAGPSATAWSISVAKAIAKWSWVLMTLLLLGQLMMQMSLWGWVLGALLLSGVVQWVVKRITRRWPVPRPFALGLCPNHLQHGPRGGFPSAHAIVMGFLVGMLAYAPLLLPQVWWSVLVLSVATAWARVYAGAHFVSDVVAGLCLGGLLGWGASQLFLLA